MKNLSCIPAFAMKVILLFFILAAVSCEELTDWDQQEVRLPKLVVDALVTDILDYSYVRLSLPVTEPGEEPRTVSNAEVIIYSGDSAVTFMESPDEKGLFIPPDGVRGQVNRIYGLSISFGTFHFTAQAGMVPVPPLKALNYIEAEDSAGYYRILPKETATPSMTRFTAEWKDDISGNDVKKVFYYYTLSTVDVNQFFKPAAEVLLFPYSARIIRQQYSLSPAHERYIRSLLSETEWKGGWFDVMPGNLQTNLSRGATGFFAASSLVMDTVYIR